MDHPHPRGRGTQSRALPTAERRTRASRCSCSSRPLHQTFTASAYRVGTRIEALQIWRSPPQPGVKQADYVVQQPTHTVVAPWKPSLTLDTSGWQPGDYLIRLDGANGAQQFVPLTVRTPSNQGRIVIINAVTTWQAYNTWGGYSLYAGPTGNYSQRARAVSFDRPYASDTMRGAGDFLYFELPFLLFAERSDIRLATPPTWTCTPIRTCSTEPAQSSRSGTTSTGRQTCAITYCAPATAG